MNLSYGCREIKISLAHPNPTAVDTARPNAADFPRPLAAVMATVLRSVFSDIASTNFSKPLAYSLFSNHYRYIIYQLNYDNMKILLRYFFDEQ